MSFTFLKGHGTHNDFVVLPDLDGTVHGDLSADLVRALCDRRGGVGADGVLRVLGSSERDEWFMDYRNADGSVSEMCGNGVRVFARYLQRAELVDTSRTLAVSTRDGIKQVAYCKDGDISVDMGTPVIGRTTAVSSAGVEYAAQSVDMGNPHAVVVVDSLSSLGDLMDAPELVTNDFPNGSNVEFVEVRGDRDLAMRVFERGVGETASCGTGACAVAAAVAAREAAEPPTTYVVEVPGGRLQVTLDNGGAIHLKGPAVLVAEGTWLG
ncbi:MAG TPA: diaminopimelate epimerase [Nocardioidaceae bacterium]|nr:diaminopimelate epimerase [Nocardioidaceae bacterium]